MGDREQEGETAEGMEREERGLIIQPCGSNVYFAKPNDFCHDFCAELVRRL